MTIARKGGNVPLRLHPTKGVNPHLTYCRRCGVDAGEIILLGTNDRVLECSVCHLKLIGGGKCPEHPSAYTPFDRVIDEHERLPAIEPCDACKAEIMLHKSIVAEGGVYWKCPDGHEGVIKATAPLAKQVRDSAGIQAPDPVGIEFTIEQCPCDQHGTK